MQDTPASTPVPIYGAGPAGLMAAEVLACAGVPVVIRDHMAKPARKFLLAGRGGLNLTHSEPLEKLLTRYGSARTHLEPAILAFPPQALREWCHGLGIETFVGTSGRVFPSTMKASPLLRAWLRRLGGLGVRMELQSPWPGFDGTPAILAFGGASWPQLGSTAAWVPSFHAAGIVVHSFTASNARQTVQWTERFSTRFAGQPLKNVALAVGGTAVRGEVMISHDGIEGGAIYALSRSFREQPDQYLHIDLRPDLTEEDCAMRITSRRSKDTLTNFLRKSFNLPDAAIALMHETKSTNPKHVLLKTLGTSGIARAISSAGGVDWNEVDDGYQLKKQPRTFIAGEMLDWDAPTGGYLLHACLATGRAAAAGMLRLMGA